VGFRLTAEEIEHLDELVTEHGFSDRSALLRAWLEQDGHSKKARESSRNLASASRTSTQAETVSRVEIHPRTNYRQTSRTKANRTRSSNPVAHVEPTPPRRRHPRITAVPHAMDSSPSPTQPKSIMRELLAELNRHKGELLIRVADVVRALLPHASMETVHDALLTLNRNGLIELRPDGGTEFLKAEDAALCPRGPRDTVFSYARFKDDSAR
jgi:hypothetical protein